jgi:hypothetical protein
MYGGYETVAMAPHRFYKMRVGRVVVQGRTQPANGHVKTEVSLDEEARPNGADDLASRYQLFRLPKKKREYLERLFLQGDSCAMTE